MSNVFSLTGATSERERNWSWCIPSVETPTLPVVVLRMTSDGPRYIPTPVMPPMSLRPLRGSYTEVRPSRDDLDLVEAVYTWRMVDPRHQNMTDAFVAALLADNVCTARKFLTQRDGNIFDAALQQVKPDDLCYGRSVLLRKGLSIYRAWLVGLDGTTFDVIASTPETARFERFSVGLRSLEEDGTVSAANTLLNS